MVSGLRTLDYIEDKRLDSSTGIAAHLLMHIQIYTYIHTYK